MPGTSFPGVYQSSVELRIHPLGQHPRVTWMLTREIVCIRLFIHEDLYNELELIGIVKRPYPHDVP